MGKSRKSRFADSYIAGKMNVPVAVVRKVRRRRWYARFERLFADLKIDDVERQMMVWKFLDEVRAFHQEFIARSALQSMLVLYQDGRLKGMTEQELERLAFQESV